MFVGDRFDPPRLPGLRPAGLQPLDGRKGAVDRLGHQFLRDPHLNSRRTRPTRWLTTPRLTPASTMLWRTAFSLSGEKSAAGRPPYSRRRGRRESL
jgi:hypothetical protein